MRNLIYFFLLLLCSCSLEEAIAPIDHPLPIDTVVVPIDTVTAPVECVNPQQVTEPKFITLYIEYFNGAPLVDQNFYFHKSQGADIAYPTLKELLIAQGYASDSIQVFQNNNAIAAIIRGTNIKSNLETRIWTRDAIGQKAQFAINIQAFLFGGALTFEEYKQIAIDLPSVRVFNFRNTNWTQAQYEDVAKIILGECKAGRDRADFQYNTFPISDGLYCLFIERGWDIVRGQNPNCSLPMQRKRKVLYAQGMYENNTLTRYHWKELCNLRFQLA